jgi:CelD/BcsL family acetyltransferase involved in cellulose biosynthesis
MVQPVTIQHSARGEVLDRRRMGELLPQWERLSRACLEDNVYYSPRYAMALLDSVAASDDVRFAVVWRDQELIALMPLTAAGLQVPYVRPTSQAWTTPYTFSCTPLLHKGHPDAAAALLDLLDGANDSEWALPSLNLDGPVCSAITEVLDDRGSPWRVVGEYSRATLTQGMTFAEHMQQCVDSRRRRELGRNMRRLAEAGQVEHRSARSGPALEAAVRDFLTIEARGWKGRHNTALACNPDSFLFAVRAFTGSPRVSICRADTLTLDGVTIAVSLTVFAGRTGFTVKCAYDEDYRKYSPGLLLESEIIRSFYAEGWSDKLDSGTAGAHVIDSLWPGRVRVGDLFFSLARQNAELRLLGITALEQLRRSVRGHAKATASRLNVLGLMRRAGSAAQKPIGWLAGQQAVVSSARAPSSGRRIASASARDNAASAQAGRDRFRGEAA